MLHRPDWLLARHIEQAGFKFMVTRLFVILRVGMTGMKHHCWRVKIFRCDLQSFMCLGALPVCAPFACLVPVQDR